MQRVITIIFLVLMLSSCYTTHHVRKGKLVDENYKTIIENQSKVESGEIKLLSDETIMARNIEFNNGKVLCLNSKFYNDTLDISNIEYISFKTGSNAAEGAGVGAATGAVIGVIAADNSDYGQKKILGALILAPIFGLGGMMIGSLSDGDVAYIFNEKIDREVADE